MSKYLSEAIKLVKENDPFKKKFSNYRPEITDNAKCVHCDSTFTLNTNELQYDPTVQCPRCRRDQNGKTAVGNFDPEVDSVLENMHTNDIRANQRENG